MADTPGETSALLSRSVRSMAAMIETADTVARRTAVTSDLSRIDLSSIKTADQ
jgi:hypothetical protein